MANPAVSGPLRGGPLSAGFRPGPAGPGRPAAPAASALPRGTAAAPAQAVRGAGIPLRPGEDPLRAATREFEAILLEMILRQLRETAEALGGEERGAVQAVYSGWMDEQLARALAAGGGLGLGEALYRSLTVSPGPRPDPGRVGPPARFRPSPSPGAGGEAAARGPRGDHGGDPAPRPDAPDR